MTADELRARFRQLLDPLEEAHGLTPRRGDHDLTPEAQAERRSEAELRPAAVLVPVLVRAGAPAILMTRRSEDLPSHAGQVSFPGGKVDDTDASPLDAALRETEEEVGIHRRFVEPLGFLDVYETGTGFAIKPVVGLVHPGYTITPEPGEVAEVFDVPLAFLLDPANHERHSAMWKGVKRTYYAMPYNDHYIWGATAGMVKNLADRWHAPEPAAAG